jgi:hypothetical protein
MSELLAIIGAYRDGRQRTTVLPLLGERGSGKTHLLYSLRAGLRQRALDAGDETLLVAVDCLSTGTDPIEYLLWQIVNYLLAGKGDGERALGVIAGRLAGRLLAEALRYLGPHKRVGLIPPTGTWDRLRLRMGSPSRVQSRLDRIESLIRTCDHSRLAPEELRKACRAARLELSTAVGVIEQHLERCESKDALGWFRKQLYSSLARLALLGDRQPFEELHSGDYAEAPANVRNVGDPGRKLLETWTELLTALRIPVVVIFDQLEDYIRAPDEEQEKTNRRRFMGDITRLFNSLKNTCVLVFAERGYWTDLLNYAEGFTVDRLRQPFGFLGGPARQDIAMPDKVPSDVLSRLIQRRVRAAFPDLDLTGLPPAFPFEEPDVRRLKDEPTIRMCIRGLARRYDEIVFPVARPGPDFQEVLEGLWKECLAAAEREHGTDLRFNVAFIPELQNAIQGWLVCLAEQDLTGSGPWHGVKLVTDTTRRQYGYLNVIRTGEPHAPGVGIAAWLGRTRGQPTDLRNRLGFFDANPCEIRTLVMLRADGEGALVGDSRAIFDSAIRAGRDVRVHKYEPRHLHAIMAFGPWLQKALEKTKEVTEADPGAAQVFRQFLKSKSADWLDWIDAWRQPAEAAKRTSA